MCNREGRNDKRGKVVMESIDLFERKILGSSSGKRVDCFWLTSEELSSKKKEGKMSEELRETLWKK